MDTKTFSEAVLAAKFRGCLIGALVGDCYGLPFEFSLNIPPKVLNNFFKKHMDAETKEILSYSDDTSMTLSIAKSLVDKKEVDPKDIAQNFVHEFYRDTYRGYGGHVPRVFSALQKDNFSDVFLPASKQFNGSGSFGNGAAMRIAPVGLFGNDKDEQFIKDAVNQCSRITHTNPHGINGATLQCFAVNAALGLNPSEDLDPINFIDNLLEKMRKLEEKSIEKPYCDGLEKMKEFFLQNPENISSEEIAKTLGNAQDETAMTSVPTAVYSFLRGTKPIAEFECDNPFMRTIYFAISVGGDTDTIACMAGGIAGAYYGVDLIPDVMQKKCERLEEVTELADKLFKVTQKQK